MPLKLITTSILLLHLLILCISDVKAGEADTVLKYDPTGSDGWIPYYVMGATGEISGIVPDVISAILSEANIKGVAINYPPKRTNQYLLAGQLDFDLVNPDWIADKQIRNRFIYSKPVIEVKEYFISRKEFDTSHFMQSYRAGTKPKVGTVRGYYYHDAAQIERVDFSSEKELIQALNYKRVDVIISGDLPAQYWSHRVQVPIKLFRLHSGGDLKIRMRPELKNKLNQINQAIITLNESGKLLEIQGRYLTETN